MSWPTYRIITTNGMTSHGQFVSDKEAIEALVHGRRTQGWHKHFKRLEKIETTEVELPEEAAGVMFGPSNGK